MGYSDRRLFELFECLSFEIILFLFMQILLSIIVIIYIIKNCLLKIILSLLLFIFFILLFLFYNNIKYRNIKDQESRRNLTLSNNFFLFIGRHFSYEENFQNFGEIHSERMHAHFYLGTRSSRLIGRTSRASFL